MSSAQPGADTAPHFGTVPAFDETAPDRPAFDVTTPDQPAFDAECLHEAVLSPPPYIDTPIISTTNEGHPVAGESHHPPSGATRVGTWEDRSPPAAAPTASSPPAQAHTDGLQHPRDSRQGQGAAWVGGAEPPAAARHPFSAAQHRLPVIPPPSVAPFRHRVRIAIVAIALLFAASLFVLGTANTLWVPLVTGQLGWTIVDAFWTPLITRFALAGLAISGISALALALALAWARSRKRSPPR